MADVSHKASGVERSAAPPVPPALVQALVNALSDAACVLGADRHVRAANALFRRLFDVDAGDVDGRALDDVVAGRWHGRPLQAWLADGDGGPRELVGPLGADGHSQRTVRARARPADGTGLTVVSFAVLEAETAAVSLLEDEYAFRELANSAPAMLWVTDPRGASTFLNRSWYRFTGQRQDEALGMGWLDAVHPDDRPAVHDAFFEANALRTAFRVDYRLRRADGVYRWALDAGTPHFDDEGRFLGFVGSVIDIDGRKQAEDALREREARFRALFSSIDEGYCLCEIILDDAGQPVDYRFLEVNPRFEAMTGLADAEGHTARELVPDLEPHWVETYGRVALGREPMRFEQGSEAMGRWFDVYAAPAEPHGRFALVFNDVTERRRAEAALRDSEERFRLLADAMPQLVWTAEIDGTVDYYNQRYRLYDGLARDAANWRWAPVLHPADLQATMEAWERAVATRSTYEIEHRVRMADGTYRWHLSRAVPIQAEATRMLRWYGTATDIHSLKQAEEALRESEERFRLMADHIAQFAWMADGDGSIFWYNRRWFEYTGTTLDEMKGWGWRAVHHPDHVERVVARIGRSFETGEPWEDTFPLRRHDGVYRWFLSRALPVRDDDGRVVRWFGTNTDVTEQRALEMSLRELNETLEQRVHERTRQVRELASTLTMAEQEERRRISQILHDDLQQQLYGIQMKLMAVRNAAHRDEPDAVRRHLAEAEDWLRSGITLTRDLTLDLSPPILHDEGLADTLGWLVGQMREKHDLAVTLETADAFHTPDQDMRVLLFQIVRELLFNVAKHAQTRRAVVSLRRVDDDVEVTVRDEGQGFDVAAAQARHDGGFGLFSVRERLGLFGGRLDVDSAPGRGTRVTFRVPFRYG